MSYENESKEILKLVGGKENVLDLVHCATRLRFRLKDEKRALKKDIEELPYVLSVVKSGGQYQIVIGQEVSDYYKSIISHLDLNNSSEPVHEKTSFVNTIFEWISSGFSPLIPVMAGSGMILAFLTVLTSMNWLSAESSTYLILYAAGNAIFYFLPIFLGYTLSQKMKVDAFVGACIGAALLNPNFMGLIELEKVSFINIPVIAINYSSTVFPIFVAIFIYVYLYRFLSRYIYKDVQLFLVSMISLMVMVPLTAILFGPVSTTIGDYIGNGIMWLIEVLPVLAGFVLGGLYPFLVILGLHWGFTPFTLQNLSQYGGDPIEGTCVVAIFTLIGISLGTFLRSKKHSSLRRLAAPATITGFLSGIIEPVLYGIILRYRRTMIIMIVSGGISGIIARLLNVTCDAYVFHNLFSLPVYSPNISALLIISFSLILSTCLTYFFGYKKEDLNMIETKLKETLIPPINGNIISLQEVKDEVFASKKVGDGIAVIPTDNIIVAPIHGKITTIFPTLHAICMKTQNGTEFMIHIGINTSFLDGKYFDMKVQVGDEVEQGQMLCCIDKEQMEKEGYDTTTILLIPYQENIKDISFEQDLLEITY